VPIIARRGDYPMAGCLNLPGVAHLMCGKDPE
jgi:hypothetical protein